MQYTPRTAINAEIHLNTVLDTMADEKAAEAAWEAWRQAIDKQLHHGIEGDLERGRETLH